MNKTQKTLILLEYLIGSMAAIHRSSGNNLGTVERTYLMEKLNFIARHSEALGGFPNFVKEVDKLTDEAMSNFEM